jgi:isopenicillin N synthase-like dioxygenase
MAETLPTIDLASFARGCGISDAAREQARLLDETFRHTGFILAKNHGVSPATKAAMLAASRAFFDEPVEAKNAIAIGKSNCHRGYVGIATETLDDKNTMAGDLKETIDTGIDHAPDHPEVLEGTPLHGPNQMPDSPAFRAAYDRYWNEVVDAAERVMRAMAIALDLPIEYFVDLGETLYNLRFIHYPPQDTVQPIEGQLGCGTHTDYGTVTLLSDDGVGGLQVMKRDGEWISVDIPDDHLVVNIGDLMAIWTNDRWVSNPHRVINPPQTDRYSIPMFVTPPYWANIECLPSCLAAGETPRHQPMLSGPYLLSRFDSTHSYRNELLAEFNQVN